MKPTAPTLSQHLSLEAKRFRGYPEFTGRGRLNRAVTELWEKALPSTVKTLQWVMPKGKGFTPTPALLDEYYSNHLLTEIPGIVRRASGLRSLEAGKTVPRQVNVYYEQAIRSFVAGLWDAAVALSRACLEATLEDRVGTYVGRTDRELAEWINEAERKRFLTPAQVTRATKIRKAGNDTLHDRSSTEREARECIDALQQILSELYR